MIPSLTSFLLLGTALTGLMMFGLWLLHLRIGNAGIVDIGWALGLGLLAVLYGIPAALFGAGPAWPRWMITAMAVVWSGRLAAHLFQRIVGNPEEGRYRKLRQQWGPNAAWKFLVFFEAQALLDVLLSLPFLLVALDTAGSRSGMTLSRAAGIVVWTIAIFGEITADAQLARFKRSSAATDVCRVGLWGYSRHPNYFFEWLIWMGWALFAQSAHLGWLAWSSPLLILFFLLRVTGIPATEAQSLRSKGEAYAEYQRTTSAFVPWFRKNLPLDGGFRA